MKRSTPFPHWTLSQNGADLTNRHGSSLLEYREKLDKQHVKKPSTKLSLMPGFLITCLVLVVIVAFTIFAFGGVTGEEFSAESFERRSFFYYRVPFIDVQFTPTFRNPINEMEADLVNKKLVTVTPTTQWEVVQSSAVANLLTSEVAILFNYLDAVDSNDQHYWLEWTDQHPKLAAEFWPKIQQVAIHKAYLILPFLFDEAIRVESLPIPDADQRIKQCLVKHAADAASNAADRSDHALAQSLAKLVAKYSPDNEVARKILSHAEGQDETPTDTP